MGTSERPRRTKWVQLIAACALLLMLAPYAQQTDRQAWLSKSLQVSAAAVEAPKETLREQTPPPGIEADVVLSRVGHWSGFEAATRK